MSLDVKNEVDQEKDKLFTEDDPCHIKMPEEKENEDQVKQNSLQTESGSFFALELFICSVLLWSFLFIMGNTHYQGIILKVDQILSTKADVVVAEDIQEEVAEVIHELLTP